MSTAKEVNRFNAHRIAEGYNPSGHGSKGLADAIFSELQVAHKRGEIFAELEIEAKDQRIAELEEWIKETGYYLRCHCFPAYTDRGLHQPECRAYLLDDCPIPLQEGK